ncbi:MAG TPA: ATP-binding protein [Chitinophagaceae bacterium]|nr:ATP-binding protein [Chitinophagaceae bacterium]
MADANKRRLGITTAVFWVLFLYIIAALLWWFFSLMQQSQVLHDLKKQELDQMAFDKTSGAYKKAVFEIGDQRRRSTYKYIGEGSIFLLLIVVGAVYIYRSVRRQLQLQQQQQNFVMAVTHELKTPLSVARLNLETLKRYQLDVQKQEKLIDVGLQEMARLDMLINNILISSQLDGKGYQPEKETLPFSELIQSEVKNFSARYPARPVHMHIEPGIELTGDALLLKLLISNLLENANKYSGKEKRITVAVQKNEGVLLQVNDEGAGIADVEKEKVFLKFYRIGNEQTRTAKGTGLGLYICKKIAAMHGASIHVSDNLPQGSIFTVQFPLT